MRIKAGSVLVQCLTTTPGLRTGCSSSTLQVTSFTVHAQHEVLRSPRSRWLRRIRVGHYYQVPEQVLVQYDLASLSAIGRCFDVIFSSLTAVWPAVGKAPNGQPDPSVAFGQRLDPGQTTSFGVADTEIVSLHFLINVLHLLTSHLGYPRLGPYRL